jgi:hypothetical protein
MKKNKIVDEVLVQPYFTDAVFENGEALEDRVCSYLNSMYFPYKRSPKGPHAGIDFIIDGKIYMDCVAQKESGSIGDKLPTKIWKYVRKYSLKEIYILHPYSPITKHVSEFLEFLEISLDCKIHILDWDGFVELIKNGELEKRKTYNFTNSSKVSNHTTASNALYKYFEYK